ncbi:MAG: putative PadR family transcriptional regulator [Phycisphaerales bacterium]|nr:putative PadR family transcriptional regulator [Phycisphaerales bacterium]
MKIERELMRGVGPVAVLRLLEGGEKYGYELVAALDRQTDGVLAMGQSTLYPLLYNLEAKGLIASRVETVESGRERKYYRLTSSGKKRLDHEREQWQAVTAAMGKLGIVGG